MPPSKRPKSKALRAKGIAPFDLPNGIQFTWGITVLVSTTGETLEPLSQKNQSSDLSGRWCEFLYRNGIKVVHHFQHTRDSMLKVRTEIFGENILLDRIILGRDSRVTAERRLDRVFWHTEAMDGFSGIEVEPEEFTSWGVAGLTGRSEGPACLAAFLDISVHGCEILGKNARNSSLWTLGFSCELEGAQLDRNKNLEIPELAISTDDSLARLLEKYADEVGLRANVSSLPKSPVGWCSWYCYYGTEDEKDILENLEKLAGSSPVGSELVFQIDDGWNLPFPNHPRVWGDWNPGQKFSRGMAWIAEQIRAKNLKPGIWLAPFSIDKASVLAAEHPQWLVQARDPETGFLKAAETGGCYVLDLTQNEVLDFVRETFRRVFSDWKFEYIKIDFLKHAIVKGIRKNPAITSRKALRNALQIIRDEAGDDRFILACGCPFGPAIGICDGMRIGLDVGGGWDPPLTLPEWPDGNCCVKAAAKPAFYRHWMHRRWWINDPDCLVARDVPLACEVDTLTKMAAQLSIPTKKPRFCLSDEEASFWTRLVSLLGGSAIISEILESASLSRNRQELLLKAFLPDSGSVRWIDCYENPEICFLQTVQSPLQVAVLNFSDGPCEPKLAASNFHLFSWEFQEDVRRESFSGDGLAICFPSQPGRSLRVWRLAHKHAAP